ncbi:carboxypeptidase-like regulatory domain-containing protein [Algoriphagus namhaensis]
MKAQFNFFTMKTLFVLGLLLFLGYQPIKAASTFVSPSFENTDDPIVRAQVVDENGKAMQGIAVLVKGSTTGTATDKNGFFELNLSKFSDEKVTLVLSFPNYNSKEVSIDMKNLPLDMGQIEMGKGAK